MGGSEDVWEWRWKDMRVWAVLDRDPEATPRVQRSYGGCDCYWLVDG